MYTEEEFKKQKRLTEKANQELRSLIPSKGYTLLAGMFDVAFLFLPALSVFLYEEHILGVEADIFKAIRLFFICLVALLLCVFILRGRSFGSILFDIDLVDMKRRQFITGEDFLELYKTKIIKDVTHHDWYEAMNYLGSNLNQDMAMKQLGIIFVRRRQMKKYLKKYKGFHYVKGSYDSYKGYGNLSKYANEVREKRAKKYGD